MSNTPSIANPVPLIDCIAAAPDGSVWAVDTHGVLLANTEHVVPWERRPGTLAAVAAASDGSVHGLDATGTLLSWQDGWVDYARPPAHVLPVDLTAADRDTIWISTSANTLYRYLPASATWGPIDPPGNKPVVRVRAASDGTVVALTRTGEVYRRTGDGWAAVATPEPVARVGVGAAGFLMVLGRSGTLHRFDGTDRPWVVVPGPAGDALVDLACGDDLTVAAVGRSGALHLTSLFENAWSTSTAPSPLAAVSAGNVSCLWALDAAGKVAQYTEHTTSWSAAGVPLTLSWISARDARTIWAVDTAGHCHLLTAAATEWKVQSRPDGPLQLTAASDGSVWGVDAAGGVLRWLEATNEWQRLAAPPAPDAKVRRVAAGEAGTVTALCDTGALYRLGADGGWTSIAAPSGARPLRGLSVVKGGAVYAVDGAGTLYFFLPPWLVAGAGLIEVSAGAADDLWGIDPDHRPVRLEHPMRENARPGPGLPGWDSEDPFDETRSTHLWIVNRAARLAGQVPDLGPRLVALVDPGAGRTGIPFHDRLCQGLYDADWLPDYNNPSVSGQPTYKSHFYDAATGTNWLGEEDPTGLTEGAKHFEASIAAYLANDPATAGYELGLSLHYLTDLTQPMHATNFTWWDSHPVLGYHGAYERRIMAVQALVPSPLTYQPTSRGDNPRAYLIAAAIRSRRFETTLVPESVQHRYNGYTRAFQDIADASARDILTESIRATSQYLIAWMRQVVRPWTDRGRPPLNARLDPLLGVTTYGDRPYVFAKGGDGRLWLDWSDGSRWSWTGLGGTGTTPIARGVGAAANADGPAVFVIGQNGHALANWWTGSAWQWTDLGEPPGTQIAGPAGVLGLVPLTAYFWGRDGRLYRVGVGPRAVGWRPVGQILHSRITGAVGATIRSSDGCAVVVAHNEAGRLMAFLRNDENQAPIDLGPPPGRLVAAGLGVTSNSAGVHCFVLGSDRHVWTALWTGTTTTWTDLGTPPDDGADQGIGAVTALDIAYVAVRGRHGAVWAGWLDGTTPRWTGKGVPTQDAVRPGARTVVSRGRPLFCAIGGDGNLWTYTRAFAPGWQPWSAISPGSRPAAGPVSAVWRDTDHLDVFATDGQGIVRTNSWEEGRLWAGWTPLDGVQLAAGAKVAAVGRDAERIDLFGTTSDGAVQSTFWEPEAGWRPGWFRIGNTTLDGGAPITAVWRDAGRLDLFGVAGDGSVQTAWWEAGSGWQPWRRVGTTGATPTLPGVTVAVAWRDPGHLDLFTTGFDGAVLTAAWTPAGEWTAWRQVPAPNALPMGSGAGVTAVWRDPGRLDLFVSGPRPAGPQGAVWSTSWTPAAGWASWFAVRPDQPLSTSGAVEARWTPGRGRLDLLATGARPDSPDGGVWSTHWWPEGGGWQPWSLVQPERRVAAKDASVTASWWGTRRLMAVVDGPDGGVNGTFWDPPA